LAKEGKKIKVTPMMRQYLDIKSEHPDHILMFRMGDFYEMFLEDAKKAAKILNIALTSRSHGDEKERIPLCGVPHHALNAYLSKLIRAGQRVAVCDQLEDPKQAKGVVKRGVTRLVSPGLVLDPETLDDRNPNYFTSVVMDQDQFGIAAVELSTGEFRIGAYDSFESLVSELVRVEPSELVVPAALEGSKELSQLKRTLSGKMTTFISDVEFETENAVDSVQAQFPEFSTDRAIRDGHEAGIRAAGGALAQLHATQMRELSHFKKLILQKQQSNMVVDEATKRNLELVASMMDGTRRGSLLWILDNTKTAMGARMLRKWICYPLIEKQKITGRHYSVDELLENFTLRDQIRELLGHIQDLERLAGRVGLNSCNARDLVSLKLSLFMLPKIKQLLGECRSPLLKNLLADLDELVDVRELIEESIQNEPPLALHEGGVIADGYNRDLDDLRKISKGGKDTLSALEISERERTKIPKLKVRYNKVFGYFIEVSKIHMDKIPDDYIRKQTLVNSERFITPELKEFEEKVLSAEEKIAVIEFDIFSRIRQQVASQISRIQKSASILAEVDILANFAQIAQAYNYARPKITSEQNMEITDGRHPVVEYAYKEEPFVPNDTEMNTNGNQLLIITGPNMAGKSTYIRQVALIQLMAQIGSFVPAGKAILPVVDRIFTRVGASDNLAKGQSTFMVEMVETANILADATDRSLVILDEIGRGTSTFDGLAIAWAVAEYLHDHPLHRPLTLFATHYHELTDLQTTKPRVKNYNVAVREYNDDIVFLRKIVPGGVSHSYGIAVAKLAGLPQDVIKRARGVLLNLEKKELDEVGKPNFAKDPNQSAPLEGQLSFFGPAKSQVDQELRAVDVDGLTPLDALKLIHRLKKKL